LFLGRKSETIIRSKPSFQEHYKGMRGLKNQRYRLFLNTGLEMSLNEHIELLTILFLTILAEDPREHGINVTVKYFKIPHSQLIIYD